MSPTLDTPLKRQHDTRRDLRRTTRIIAAISIVAGPALVTAVRAVMPIGRATIRAWRLPRWRPSPTASRP